MAAAASSSDFIPLKGHCTCKALTYAFAAPPLVTHCCHCTHCQRETGSAFAINSVIECYNFNVTSKVQPEFVGIPSASSPTGDNHQVALCPECRTHVFAYYAPSKTTVFVKVGTLDDASRQRAEPQAHIFTDTKLNWVNLDVEKERGVPVYEGFYEHEDVWSKESMERLEKLRTWATEKNNNKA